MRYTSSIFHGLILFVAPYVTASDLLWDNGDWDWSTAVSSERGTLIPESWLVDDSIFDQPVVIRGFEWISLMPLDMEPVGADLLVLTDGFEPVAEIMDLAFTRQFEGMAFGVGVYRVTLTGLAVGLDPGRFYIGGRMVGDGTGRAHSAVHRTIYGETEAYFRSDHFGFPDWTSLSDTGVGYWDIAFKVYGDIIPPPGTLAVGLAALACVRRRRAHGTKPGRQR